MGAMAQLNVWRVLCISPAHLLCAVARSICRRHVTGRCGEDASGGSRTGSNPSAPEGAELARLQPALDVLVDLVLGRARIGAPQLPRAQAAELEDLQHVDQVRARGQRDDEAG